MDSKITSYILLVFILMTFSGCAMIEDIFAAGAWVGAIGALIIFLVIFFIVRSFKR